MGEKRKMGARAVTLAGVAGGLALLTAGCSVDPSQAQEAVCAQLEELSPQQIERIYETAKSNLESQGIVFQSKLWEDRESLQRLFAEVERGTQCTLGTKPRSVRSALHQGAGENNYCGWGHGTGGALSATPVVSKCLNRACFEHDSCYTRCSAATAVGDCSWGGPTLSCDQAFFAVADVCDNTGDKFWSAIVLLLARGLAKTTGGQKGCAPAMTCPSGAEIGRGVCATDPTGVACAACLAKLDSACTERSRKASDAVHTTCAHATSDPICLNADCPDAHKCYGAPTVEAGAPCDTSTQCATGCCLLFDDMKTTRCQEQVGVLPKGAIACTCKQTSDCRCNGAACSSDVSCSGGTGTTFKTCGTG